MTLSELIDEIINDIEMNLCDVESVADDLRIKIESLVAGDNAAYYRAAERLVNTASSALEEAIGWLRFIK